MNHPQRGSQPRLDGRSLLMRNLGLVHGISAHGIRQPVNARCYLEISTELNMRSGLDFFGDVVHSFAIEIAEGRSISTERIGELMVYRLRAGHELHEVWDALVAAYCYYAGR